MKLAKALIMPHIERQPLHGLGKDIQRKMTLTLGREVNPPAQAPPQSMENFPGKGDSKRKCQMCLNALPKEGYKAEKDRISRMATQCCHCEIQFAIVT